jgi:hypothetical protein
MSAKSKTQSSKQAKAVALPQATQSDPTQKQISPRVNGRFAPGYSGNPGGDAGRARRNLNLATIKEMQRAFDQGGRKAIEKVMREQPAIFLKMLVLLVPRELEIQHSGGVKNMTDEQLENAIEALERMLNAKVIDASAT